VNSGRGDAVHDDITAPHAPPGPSPDSPASPPAIPAQRRPPTESSQPAGPDPAAPNPDAPAFAIPLLITPPRRRRRRAILLGAGALILVAVLAVVGAVMIHSPRGESRGTPAAAADLPSATPIPLTPYEKMVGLLKEQSAALLRGDERGWLAAIDPRQPKLRAQYRSMFRSLRGLGVSHFEYSPGIQTPSKAGVATVNVDIYFCFSLDTCTLAIAPIVRQTLTFAPIHGRYAITRLKKSADQTWLQPTPWESGTLVFAQGKRVTVAAAPSEAERLKQVVKLADKAAAVTDRFAGYVNNPQKRYRIFLADTRTWRSWYGGETDKWTTGLEIPLNEAQSDVVLKMSQLGDPAELARTIQHEMGHVATVGGATEDGDFLYRENQWLSEGVAEYIEWSPRGATASYRRASVRYVLRGSHRPKTIAAKPLSDSASDRSIDAFYGLGHFAVDCMAHEYGQRRMFDFIRLRLRQGEELDLAARHAYGQSFATIDRTCVAWIRQKA
jgi:hypothetical protein